MKAIVGLGNPGLEYERTRHNIGFMVIDSLIARLAPGDTPKAKFNALVVEAMLGYDKVLLVKPMTFMNRSGQTIGEIARFYQMDVEDDLLVIVDDVALPLGDLRLRPTGSAGSHNGLRDIQQRLGSAKYPRLRIGIDEPGRIARVNFVLGRFTEEERPIVDSAVQKAVDACRCWSEDGTTTAMNRFNTPKVRPERKTKSKAKIKTEDKARATPADDVKECEKNVSRSNEIENGVAKKATDTTEANPTTTGDHQSPRSDNPV